MNVDVHTQFTNMVRDGAFEPVRRYLSPVEQDDRLAEGVAQTFELAQRKASRGERMDDALVVYATRLRALDIRRQFVRGGQPRRDVLHRANFVDGRVAVHRLDGLVDDDSEFQSEPDRALQASWLAATSADPADALASAVDAQRWVESLPDEDRDLLAARYAGFTLSEIAAQTGTTISPTFSRLRRLGVELAGRAGVVPPVRPRRSSRRRQLAAA